MDTETQLALFGAESGWIDRWGVKNQGFYYMCKLFALVVLILATINIYNP